MTIWNEEGGDMAASANVRVQYRLDLQEGPTGFGDATATKVGAAIDVETTGKVVETGAVIEMAIRRFRYDAQGIVTHVDRSHCWREDPGFPIPPEITRLTGMTDQDVQGHRIDDEVATRLLHSASIVVAHNARFDRPWVERRLEGLGDLAWACSMTEVDWGGRGLDGRALGHLLSQVGWFHEAHRSASDVDAVIQLLRHRFADGSTALSELLARSATPSWIIHAVGASFDVKDALRNRGYRWNPTGHVWWKEIDDGSLLAEEFWLAGNVYSAEKGSRAMGPQYEQITSATRFR